MDGSTTEGIPNEQPGDSLAEWRSSEQVENGTPSTSPPFWDTDDDDDEYGAKASDLYGEYTWRIEKFSLVDKRELRSDVFEAGGYKWYILIYPHGCDVSNHLSLFLCVSSHDKLLPGWSHFAQFTIAVLNSDPKQSKQSDTLHRFWKKEHDWGWKKFMELSKVSEDFIVEDTLVIKAQVQVIRENAQSLFRCLDRHYRRDLLRIYSSNAEQICRRFVEERRSKLSKLIEDKMRWSSFRAFWLGIDQKTRRCTSRDKTDAILKVVVKHFFIEKEVTSTLVMDSLYSGLKALECQTVNKTGRPKLVDVGELPAPMVCIEKDMFVLADDVLLLLQRAALEPLPPQPLPPKDDKGPQNRTKDAGSADDWSTEFTERAERRLTKLGRRALEIFILVHIFSKIEVAYQEAVALKRQEELIREEEAAGQVEAKRGAAEREKRTKKKQAKPKRNSRKGKDKGRDEKSDSMMQDKHQPENLSDGRISEITSSQEKSAIDKIRTLEDASDVSDTGDDASEALQPELDDRDTVSINGDIDRLEAHPAVEASGSEIQNGFVRDGSNPSSDATTDATRLCDDADNCRVPPPEPEAIVFSSKDRKLMLEQQHLVEKEEVVSQQKKLIIKDPVEMERPSKSRTTESSSSSSSPGKKTPLAPQQPKQSSENTGTAVEPVSSKEPPSKTDNSALITTKSPQISSTRSEAQKPTHPAKSTTTHRVPPMSRPFSAPIIPSPRTTAPAVSTVQSKSLLPRSLSSAGRLSTDPSPSPPTYVPHSYRNTVIVASSTPSQPVSYSQPPSAFVSTGPMLSSLTSARNPQTAPRPGYTFGSVTPDGPQTQHPWRDSSSSSSSRPYDLDLASDVSRVSDEFPHLAIINDLLNDDQSAARATSRHHHSFNRQYTFPRDVATADVGSSGGGHCRPDRAEHYSGEGFQRVYCSSSSALHGLRDPHRAQMDLSGYADAQSDGAVQNRWPYRHTDLSTLNSGGVDANGLAYQYHLREDPDSTCGEGGYSLYRSNNGR